MCVCMCVCVYDDANDVIVSPQVLRKLPTKGTDRATVLKHLKARDGSLGTLGLRRCIISDLL